jgi:hypothetical protein
LDGSIPNMLTVDPTIDHLLSNLSGIPKEGATGFITDSYGIVYTYHWTITGDTIDITSVIRDPRIPGQEESGRIEIIGKSRRVIKNGIITITRQIIRVLENGQYVILGQGESSMEGEFQSTFGCGDEYGDPFYYHLGCAVTDQIEFESGTVLLQDPEDTVTEYEWWPEVIVDGNGDPVGFSLPNEFHHGPISELPPPTE